MHLVRYYGAYANRKRRALRDARAALAGQPQPPEQDTDIRVAVTPARPGSAEAIRRQAWARMIKKVFEVDPLTCVRCNVEMIVVARITEPVVIDRILAHRRKHGLVSPFEAEGPERAEGESNGANPPRAPPAA